jgi:hypothetical protein
LGSGSPVPYLHTTTKCVALRVIHGDGLVRSEVDVPATVRPIPVARELIGTPFHVPRESRQFFAWAFSYFFLKSDSNLGEQAEARACHVFATGLLLRDDPVAHLRPPPPRPIS